MQPLAYISFYLSHFVNITRLKKYSTPIRISVRYQLTTTISQKFCRDYRNATCWERYRVVRTILVRSFMFMYVMAAVVFHASNIYNCNGKLLSNVQEKQGATRLVNMFPFYFDISLETQRSDVIRVSRKTKVLIYTMYFQIHDKQMCDSSMLMRSMKTIINLSYANTFFHALTVEKRTRLYRSSAFYCSKRSETVQENSGMLIIVPISSYSYPFVRATFEN